MKVKKKYVWYLIRFAEKEEREKDKAKNVIP